MAPFGRLFDPIRREQSRHQRTIDEINALEEDMKALSDAQLRAKTDEFRELLDVSATDDAHGASHTGSLEDEDGLDAVAAEALELELLETQLGEILPEAFAVVREMASRVLGMRHYDVQLMGGIVLHQGKIAEMGTGEGKTLVATLPLYLNALAGRGAHLVTVNDYLARRDAGWNAPLYHALGLSVSVISTDMSLIYDPDYIDEGHTDPRLQHLRPCTRREAYLADITYATNNEVGFDYLRDNMVHSLADCRQRRLHYAIVDEVDSILIDEARTPLIISGQGTESTDRYYQYAQVVRKLVAEEDYTVDEESRTAALTDEGASKIERAMGIGNLYDVERVADAHQAQKALAAHAIYRRDREYIVVNREVIIVDEFTGRTMPGRRWSDGLHQAVEAKEGVPVNQENVTLATITFQNYFRLYRKLSGMTGTALTESEEFDKIYKLEVVPIPPNRPAVREDKHDLIYVSEEAKYKAVVAEVVERHAKGQPVLVGTTNIEKSERLASMIQKQGITPNVLNAKQHEREATIIAEAGQLGAVTIATNMAGRGTDIKLGEGVAELGGLCILGTERHESRRIDNQLRGRAGRQGDPGHTRFMLSFEDDVMKRFGGERLQSVMERFKFSDEDYIENKLVTRQLEGAQSRVEGFNFDARRSIVEYDDVMNKQRELIYGERRKVLEGSDTRGNFLNMLEMVINREVETHLVQRGRGNWDIEALWTRLEQIAPVLGPFEGVDVDKLGTSATEIAESLIEELTAAYEEIEARYDEKMIREVEQFLMLGTIDERWTEYLSHMTHLRDEVQFHGVGQLDPLTEFKNAAFEAFQSLVADIEVTIVNALLTDLPKRMDQLNEQARLQNEAGTDERPDAAPAALEATAPPSPRADKPGQARTDAALLPPAARPAAAEASAKLAHATNRMRQGGVLSARPLATNVVASGGGTAAPPSNARSAAGAGAGGGAPRKVGRNEPCYCGSGKKYKMCHGA